MGVGHDIEADNAAWSFGNDVPETFVDHIKASVPLYESGHDLVCQLSDFFVHNDSIVYEIGTSTGGLLKKLALHNAHKPNARWIGFDVEEKMVAKARRHCAGVENIETLLEDAQLIDLEKADLIVSYYTMQFIAQLTKFHRIIYGLSALLVVALVALPRCSPRESKLMANMLIIGILVNAFVCGGVSQPADRYGARVAFLLPLGLAFLLIFLQRHRAKATKVGG